MKHSLTVYPLLNQSPDEPVSVSLRKASEMPIVATEWIWAWWLAAGKMHILGGAPGTGKTTISMNLAAIVSKGGMWPDGTKAPKGSVLIWSGEDDPADTLIPRLAMCNADLDKVYFIGDVKDSRGDRSFDPARDMEALRNRMTEILDLRLLIVDPIVSAIQGDSHKNAEVRRGLQPLVDLATAMKCALLGITHFTKGTGGREPVERITGSLAFAALARIVMVTAKHQSNDEGEATKRLFCRAKSNIGPDDGGFLYEVIQGELQGHRGIIASAIQWGDKVEGSARELLAEADAVETDDEGASLKDAKQFLIDLLSDSPMPQKAVRSNADGAGYAWATIRRAQKALGVKSRKDGLGAWLWHLPDITDAENSKVLKKPEDAQQKMYEHLQQVEHLQAQSGQIEVDL